MSIIGQTPNKIQVDINEDDFESVNLDYFVDESEAPSDLDVIPYNIKSINKLMALDGRLEYFVTNNDEAIIKILTKHEMIDVSTDLGTPNTSNSLFQYDNVGLAKQMMLVPKIDDVDVVLTCDDGMNVVDIVPPDNLQLLRCEKRIVCCEDVFKPSSTPKPSNNLEDKIASIITKPIKRNLIGLR